MKKDLAVRLKTVCDSGSLLHVALDRDIATGQWRASYRNAENNRNNIVLHRDPIEALCEAISPLRQPKTPQPKITGAKTVKRSRGDDDLI